MAPQAGKIYRYLRTDADHDISARTLELTVNETDTDSWFSVGVDRVDNADLPAACAARDATTPPADGFVGFWWRVLTGPGTRLPLDRGRNLIAGRLTDVDETPHFSWLVVVDDTE